MNVGYSPEKLYEEDPKLRREDVKIFREWLQKQAHMPELKEIQLMLFLHSCYYRIEAAKVTIDAYFTRRTLYPELFRCPREDVLRKALSVGTKMVLPRKTPQGYHVFLASLIDSKPDNYNFIHDVIVMNLVGTLHGYENGPPKGVVALLDFKGSTLAHLARVNLLALKRSLDHLQEGVPVRIKGVHLINSVSFIDKVIALAKPFLNNQLFGLVHSSLDTLYKYVPKECLPENYGGDLPTVQMLHEKTVKNIFENLDFFKWHENQTVDESRRMEKSDVLDPNFGVEGTFKKLEID